MMKQITFETPEVGTIIKESPIPTPFQDEVLLKVNCSNLKPIEKVMTTGAFKGPYLMGIEISGVIEKIGPGVPSDVIGKKAIAYSGIIPLFKGTFTGTWAQYLVRKFKEIYIYDQDITHEQACGMYGNPLCAIGLFNQAKLYKVKTCILNAGMANISRIFEKLCLNNSIIPIVLVRKDEHVKELLNDGIKYALNIQNPNFMEELRKVILETQPSFFIDSINDESSMKIFLEMPDFSRLCSFGSMSGGLNITIPFLKFLVQNKQLIAYNWSYEDYIKPRSQINAELDIVNKDLKNSGKIFGVKIAKEYKMEEFKKALEEQPQYASTGRVLLRFW